MASTTTTPAGSGAGTSADTAVGSVDRPEGQFGPPADWFRRHLVFIVVLLVALGWRILVQWAFPPALVVAESGSHLSFVSSWTPGIGHPDGYGLLELTPLSWFSGVLGPVAAAQHLLGLATGVVVYVLLLRWAVWPWLAALATVPVLWGAYALVSEHLVLPDTLFVCLIAVALLVLCWSVRPTYTAAASGGVLLGAAAIVRPVGLPLVVAALAFMILAGTTWRNRLTGALVVAIGFGAPVLGYVAWYHHVHGDYLLAASQPNRSAAVGASSSQSAASGSLAGFESFLDWSQTDPQAYHDVAKWQFTTYLAPQGPSTSNSLYDRHGGEQLDVRQPAADALAGYQRHAYLPGPVVLGCLLLGLLAGAGLGRAAPSGMRAVCLLAAAAPACALLGAAVTAQSSWRNQLPALVLLPVAGALGLTALLRGRRSSSAERSQTDDVDRAALAAFSASHGHPLLAPVVVVIAAYNEAVGLPRVLSRIPSEVCGLATDVVVVDDGSTDGTAAAASARNGTHLVTCTVNRGQGAAMRLGYRVARSHGARYIITTDADAQYDTADFPVVLAPLLDGSADFVTGSRRLGHQHTIDWFRRAGVYVFSWIVSALTGERLTDTSFGLRAMRAEVTAAVTLNQPQYQSAELLIGVHSHGYRIAEVPGTMHLRAAGGTKKGGNLVYGMRYARVVFGTWWREGCPQPIIRSAPAMRERRAPAGATRTSRR